MSQVDGESALGPQAPIPTCWADVNAITGGLSNVAKELIAKGRIDREYHFEPTGQCGRASCERTHGWGYIIALPGMHYVNIGHCCCANYAPGWKVMHRDFRDRQNAYAAEQAFRPLQQDAQAKASWLEGMADEARSLTELRNLFLRELKGGVADEIIKRAQELRPRVERHVSISAKDRQARGAMLHGGRVDVAESTVRVARFEVHHLGDLVGLGAFKPMCDPMARWTRLHTLIALIARAEYDCSDRDDRKALMRAGRDFGSFSNDLLASIGDVRAFFAPKNLQLVCKLSVARGQGITSIEVSNSAVLVRRA